MSTSITLLPNELIVTSSDNGVLILTNRRVRYDSVVLGRSHLVSITLDSVASCGAVTKSYPFLLVLGAITLVAFFAAARSWFLLFVAAALIAAYFFTRRSVISVASNGGEVILAPTQGMSRDSVVAFIDAVEREKLSVS